MIEAILWDNDGVLMDTEKLFFEATRQAFARLGLALTPQIWGAQYLSQGIKKARGKDRAPERMKGGITASSAARVRPKVEGKARPVQAPPRG